MLGELTALTKPSMDLREGNREGGMERTRERKGTEGELKERENEEGNEN